MTGRSTIWVAKTLAWAIACAPLGVLAQDWPTLQSFSAISDGIVPQPWRVVGLPGNKTPLTRFDVVPLQGEYVLRVASDNAYGNLVQPLNDFTPLPGTRLRWRWRLERGVAGANLKLKSGDDAALKICLLFDMPLDKLSLMERSLVRAARAMNSEQIPSATLCYVWDPLSPIGSEFPNAYSKRLRFRVVDSSQPGLGSWITHERDITADFRSAFGQETDVIPPLMGIAVGADTDNTHGSSLAYVGDLVLLPAPTATKAPKQKPGTP